MMFEDPRLYICMVIAVFILEKTLVYNLGWPEGWRGWAYFGFLWASFSGILYGATKLIAWFFN